MIDSVQHDYIKSSCTYNSGGTKDNDVLRREEVDDDAERQP